LDGFGCHLVEFGIVFLQSLPEGSVACSVSFPSPSFYKIKTFYVVVHDQINKYYSYRYFLHFTSIFHILIIGFRWLCFIGNSSTIA
jgi:hypothetical protein